MDTFLLILLKASKGYFLEIKVTKKYIQHPGHSSDDFYWFPRQPDFAGSFENKTQTEGTAAYGLGKQRKPGSSPQLLPCGPRDSPPPSTRGRSITCTNVYHLHAQMYTTGPMEPVSPGRQSTVIL